MTERRRATLGVFISFHRHVEDRRPLFCISAGNQVERRKEEEREQDGERSRQGRMDYNIGGCVSGGTVVGCRLVIGGFLVRFPFRVLARHWTPSCSLRLLAPYIAALWALGRLRSQISDLKKHERTLKSIFRFLGRVDTRGHISH